MSTDHAGLYGPDNVVRRRGSPVAGAAYSVFEVGTDDLVTLYTDRDRSDTADNPGVTDEIGNLSFWADPGYYDLKVGTATALRILVPLDPSDAGSGAAVSGVAMLAEPNTFTEPQTIDVVVPVVDFDDVMEGATPTSMVTAKANHVQTAAVVAAQLDLPEMFGGGRRTVAGLAVSEFNPTTGAPTGRQAFLTYTAVGVGEDDQPIWRLAAQLADGGTLLDLFSAGMTTITVPDPTESGDVTSKGWVEALLDAAMAEVLTVEAIGGSPAVTGIDARLTVVEGQVSDLPEPHLIPPLGGQATPSTGDTVEPDVIYTYVDLQAGDVTVKFANPGPGHYSDIAIDLNNQGGSPSTFTYTNTEGTGGSEFIVSASALRTGRMLVIGHADDDDVTVSLNLIG